VIVRCIASTGADLPVECLDDRLGLGPGTDFHLEVGADYVVYGLTVFLGHVWYYVADENFSYYPVWKPGSLFEAVDGTLSRFWVYGWHPPDEHGDEYPIFSFPEWANDRFFYDRLTDGEAPAVDVFRRYKALMDEEATGAS
jgi:hypothetical protein